jgi:hypothetical protein
MQLPKTLLRGALAAAGLLLYSAVSPAQMVTFDRMIGRDEVLGYTNQTAAKDYQVQEIDVQSGSSHGANVLWPGETPVFKFRLTNTTENAIAGNASIHVIGYGTRGQPGDVWSPIAFRISREPDVPLAVNIPAKGFQDVSITPKIPARFGGYVLVFDLPGHGQLLGANLVRCIAPDPGRVQNPTYAVDLQYGSPVEAMTMLQKLGIKGFRTEFGYSPTTNDDFPKRLKEYESYFDQIKAHDLTAMLTVEGSLNEPLGVPFRPYLNDKGEAAFAYPGDTVWPPKYDADFRSWCKTIAGNMGWPKGPVNAMELWNEPWEGVSVSGWGADMPRFRELYEQMALGVRDARKDDATYVLSGGACSSTNTRDKLFPDGSDKFLPYLDFISIHYQPLAADPALVPEWIHRKPEMGGPVQVWDTESWVGNSEDRVGGVLASMRSLGQSRTAGIFHGNVYSVQEAQIDGARVHVAQTYPPAAAVAATQKFIGQRPFKQLVIKNGLPWIYEFGGRPLSPDDKIAGKPDDGTLVVLGDLGALYDRDRTLFRTVYGLQNRAEVEVAKKQLEATKPQTPEYDKAVANLARVSVIRGATLSFATQPGFVLYDFYGNVVPPVKGKFVIPLNDNGYFLRTDGRAGSFAKLRAAVAAARIDGIEPVEIVAHDLLTPIASKPVLHLTLTNVLNRPLKGTLHVSLGSLKLDQTDKVLSLAPQSTQDVTFTVTGGESSEDNQYLLSATFDAGADGRVPHEEKMRVNNIAKRTIAVDGDLSDWKDVLPQAVNGGGIGATLTQQAWLPFVNWGNGTGSGLAVGYLAYDDQNFYFAAKIADSTPSDGTVRFATRDDDQYYYPEVSYDTNQNHKAMVWPADTRRYSYRKNPDLPADGGDNMQLAFNVVPEDKKPLLEFAPGTEPRYQIYQDTDYEYALNQVAPQFNNGEGGGTEIWRMEVPGMPRKMFYPRQPKSPFDGAVTNGKLAMKRDATTRIVECALPWTELPLVRQALDAGQPIKFSFRVNDNQGSSYELANGRSVSKNNSFAFHNDWEGHWANELEFEFAR